MAEARHDFSLLFQVSCFISFFLRFCSPSHRQYLFNIDDAGARRLVRRLTLRDEAEILAAEAAADAHPEGRDVQRLLIEGAATCQTTLGCLRD